eukprot:TRINITY_DN53938_c0_g1_i1.p1 TRINITY_DN53938_c0_g1~~TRINITY_DN53938_c0_g1_i1.p1  ORF type:complete len:301 (-),score=42.80 TRINITY_DN53938_c0_g1_i1:109-1011(-)
MLSTLSDANEAQWGRPYGVAAEDPLYGKSDPALYVSDERSGILRRVDDRGRVRDVVKGLRTPQGITVAGGRVYVCEASRGRVLSVDVETGQTETAWEGLKIPAGAHACCSSMTLWVASAGDHAVYARDLRCREESRVVAGVPGSAGNMKYNSCGDGGPALEARLFSPYDVAAAPNGEVYVADSFNGRVRMVSGGLIQTIAGADQACPRGNGGEATEINIGQPRAIALSSGGPYVATSPGVVWQLRNERMDPVVGTFVDGQNGDEGDALEMRLHTPCGVCLWGDRLAIADSDNKRICVVSF